MKQAIRYGIASILTRGRSARTVSKIVWGEEMKIGDKFHIDTGEVSQYEDERIVDDVEII